MAPFYGWSSTASALEPLRGGIVYHIAISRAILKLVYWCGIPSSGLQFCKRVKINSSKNTQMTVQEPREQSFGLECKIAKIFQGFAPEPHWGQFAMPPYSTTAQGFFPLHRSSKNWHPPNKLLDMALTKFAQIPGSHFIDLGRMKG